MSNRQVMFVLLIALVHPMVSFRSRWYTCRDRLKTSSISERESNEESEKTPLAQFMEAFADSLLVGSTNSFQKITLTEPVDD